MQHPPGLDEVLPNPLILVDHSVEVLDPHGFTASALWRVGECGGSPGGTTFISVNRPPTRTRPETTSCQSTRRSTKQEMVPMSKYLTFPDVTFKDRRLLLAALAD